MRKVLVALLMLVLPVSAPRLAAAQATGTITGVASDPADAPVPGVTIDVTNTAITRFLFSSPAPIS